MKSFRVQVVLWISVVVAVAIIGVSTAMSALNSRRISDAIDRDLVMRAHEFGRRGPPGGRPGGPFGAGGPPPGRTFGDAQADLIGAIRSPRLLNLEGQPRSQFGWDDAFDRDAAKRAVRQGELFTQVDYHGQNVRVYSLPIVQDGAVRDVVQVARELRDFYEIQSIQRSTLAIFLPLGLFAAILVAWFLTGRVVQPLKRMQQAAHAIGSGNLSERIAVAGDDEVAQLGQEFNKMAESVESSIHQLEKSLEQQRQFTADASHELRTPLTRVLMATSSALDANGDYKQAVETVDSAARDMSKLVRQLLDLAQLDAGAGPGTFQPLDLRLALADAVEKTPGSHPSVVLPDTEIRVLGNADQLERAVGNLLENASKYGGNTVELSLSREGDWAIVTVRDNGPGVPSDALSHLTERFYRVDSARTRETGGTGLGLAIVKETVEAHGGRLELSSEPEKGLTARLWLPMA